jgi:hypothetical protein
MVTQTNKYNTMEESVNIRICIALATIICDFDLFSFGYYIVCPSYMYHLFLHLQTFLFIILNHIHLTCLGFIIAPYYLLHLIL